MAFTSMWDFHDWLLSSWRVELCGRQVTVWPGRKELKVSSFLGAQVNTARFAWHLQYVGLSWLATFKLTRRIVWQAQYFVTVWPGRKELKVSSFLGAQVNTARFAWHLQYVGLSWLVTFRLTRRIVWLAAILCDVLTWAEGTESV